MSSRSGVYGFRLDGVSDLDGWLASVPDSWPTVDVDAQAGDPCQRTRVGPDDADLLFPEGVCLTVDRASASIRVRSDQGVPGYALAHPYLAPACSLLAHWRGWLAFHAGGFVADQRGWLVVGERGSGKSTLLAELHSQGFGILSDDLIVIRNGRGLAGPRSIDLRGPHPGTEHVGRIGYRERYRVRLGPVAPEVPLGGVIFLEWGNSLEVRSLPASEKASRLFGARAVLWKPEPVAMLKALGLPAWRIARLPDSVPNASATAVLTVVRG